MRDYMSPAVKHVTRVIQHPSAITAAIIKHRALTFAVTATVLAILAISFMLAKNSIGEQAVHNDALPGTTQPSLDTKVTANGDTTKPVTDGGSTVSDSSNSGDSASSTSSHVTVNNQSIPVPQNGTVTKTVTSGNGTTTVNVTSNSTSSTSGNSTTSTNLNVNTHTVTKNESGSE